MPFDMIEPWRFQGSSSSGLAVQQARKPETQSDKTRPREPNPNIAAKRKSNDFKKKKRSAGITFDEVAAGLNSRVSPEDALGAEVLAALSQG